MYITKSYPLHNYILYNDEICVNNIVVLQDLPNSQNLRSEMRNIAEGQVKQVVDLEKRKQMK